MQAGGMQGHAAKRLPLANGIAWLPWVLSSLIIIDAGAHFLSARRQRRLGSRLLVGLHEIESLLSQEFRGLR